jgi:hypothetical protein
MKEGEVHPAIRGRGRYGRLENRLERDTLGSRAQRQRHQLKVFVRLAGTRLGTRIEESEAVDFPQAEAERLEIAPVQRAVLVLEGAGDDEGVVLQDAEPIEEAEVGCGEMAGKEVGIVGEKRVSCKPPLAAPRQGLSLQARSYSDHEPDTPILNRDNLGRDGIQRSSLTSEFRLFLDP